MPCFTSVSTCFFCRSLHLCHSLTLTLIDLVAFTCCLLFPTLYSSPCAWSLPLPVPSVCCAFYCFTIFHFFFTAHLHCHVLLCVRTLKLSCAHTCTLTNALSCPGAFWPVFNASKTYSFVSWTFAVAFDLDTTDATYASHIRFCRDNLISFLLSIMKQQHATLGSVFRLQKRQL